MKLALNIIQLIVAFFLIILILLQQKSSGLGGAFGGDGALYTTRRGPEKVLHITTIIFSAAFLALAAINAFIIN